VKSAASLTKICHRERSIAIGFFNRNAESRDLLVGATANVGEHSLVFAGWWPRGNFLTDFGPGDYFRAVRTYGVELDQP
jgi:hypothetical protein